MAILDMLKDVDYIVKDIIALDFQVVKAQGHYVPGYEDTGLSFERGVVKKSKTICTCVLYVDIRNSTTLSHEHDHETMARLYTSFTKSILSVAEYHGAVVRNIIGDRVMLVFPQDNCFSMAVDTAISINTISNHIINKRFTGLKFEVGIGIDYGEMMIVKAGIPKREPERTNYKNLIWIGKPANIASKLTDVANKNVTRTYFKVRYQPYNFSNMFPIYGLGGTATTPTYSSVYLNTINEDILTEADFIKKIDYNNSLGITYSGGKFLSFLKEEKTMNDPSILISEAVFQGYKKNNPTRWHYFFKPQLVTVKDYTGTIYGAGLEWTEHKQL